MWELFATISSFHHPRDIWPSNFGGWGSYYSHLQTRRTAGHRDESLPRVLWLVLHRAQTWPPDWPAPNPLHVLYHLTCTWSDVTSRSVITVFCGPPAWPMTSSDGQPESNTCLCENRIRMGWLWLKVASFLFSLLSNQGKIPMTLPFIHPYLYLYCKPLCKFIYSQGDFRV